MNYYEALEANKTQKVSVKAKNVNREKDSPRWSEMVFEVGSLANQISIETRFILGEWSIVSERTIFLHEKDGVLLSHYFDNYSTALMYEGEFDRVVKFIEVL